MSAITPGSKLFFWLTAFSTDSERLRILPKFRPYLLRPTDFLETCFSHAYPILQSLPIGFGSRKSKGISQLILWETVSNKRKRFKSRTEFTHERLRGVYANCHKCEI